MQHPLPCEFRHASVVAVDARSDLVTFVQGLPTFWRTSIWPINEWITPESVLTLMAKANELMGGVDLISLDIDGNDYWVARELDLSSVSIIVVEYNPLFGATSSVSVPRNDKFDRTQEHSSWLYFGASIRAWVDLFSPQGFRLVGTNRAGNNAFFCRENDLNRIPLPRVDTQDLTIYTDWCVRESRDANEALNYLAGQYRIRAISQLPLVHVSTGHVSLVEVLIEFQ